MEPVEHHIAIRRSARYWSMGRADGARSLWIVCHGFGQLAERFLRRFEPIAADDVHIVAPEALNRFYLDGRMGPHGPASRVGATWMTREDREAEIDDYVGWLDTLHDHLAPPQDCRILVLGFSQGVATVTRWAARTDRRIDDLILWSGGPGTELAPGPALFHGARVSLVAGETDRMVPVSAMRILADRFARAGLPARLHVHAGGHDVTPDGLASILSGV